MIQDNNSNRRIARNTIALYFRMFLTMFVGIFTSRVVLRELGVSDFGIYNVVGGFVSMMAFLNAVLVDSSQRFIAFAIGEKNQDRLKSVFGTSLVSQCILSLIVLLFAETFGLWFVNNKLIIDTSRMVAANWVYQSSVVSLVFTIVTISHKSTIVAHEDMHIYAYVSLVETILKLLIVFLLPYSFFDKLITYAILHLIVSIATPIYFVFYCIKKYSECRNKIRFEKSMLAEMLSFSGWVLVGNLGFTFKDQFSNVIMNLFLGTLINAARGIATQVNSLVLTFSNNIFMAISPQITKQYAIKDYSRCKELIYSGARYSFYMMLIMVIPIILNIDFVLKIWLVTVPDLSAQFLVITLIASLFFALSKSLTTALQATGDIKLFQIGVSVIMLLELPLTYIMLFWGCEPYIALLPTIVTNFAALFFRAQLLEKKLKIFRCSDFFLHITIKCFLVAILSYLFGFMLCYFLHNSIMYNIVKIVLSVIATMVVVYSIGFSQTEKLTINKFVLKKIYKK